MRLTSRLFRQKVGASDLERTAQKAVQTLASGGIPSTVVGGYALQEHGYHRNTLDVDLLVPSIDDAWDRLSIRGFKPSGSKAILYDRETGVEINLLQSGQPATNASPLPLPQVSHEATDTPFIMPLDELIEMKLNVYVANTQKYGKHGADVVELIKLHKSPADSFHSTNSKIQDSWTSLWNAIHSED